MIVLDIIASLILHGTPIFLTVRELRRTYSMQAIGESKQISFTLLLDPLKTLEVVQHTHEAVEIFDEVTSSICHTAVSDHFDINGVHY